MRFVIGNDHAAYEMKQVIAEHLKQQGHEVMDVGVGDVSASNYPVSGYKVAKAVKDGEADLGIAICGTGIGMSIVANKVPGIRAGLCSDTTAAYLTRAHNDANVLAMGAGMIGMNVAIDIVDTFLKTEFSNEEKHIRRIAAIEA